LPISRELFSTLEHRMHRRPRPRFCLRPRFAATALAACVLAAQAQTPPSALGPTSLQQAFEAAWARQPEALALLARRDAAQARQAAARAWTPEPAALELATKTDRLNGNRGTRELEVGVAVPIWLPGERGRSAALAQADGAAVESRAQATKLRVAATVREAWWAWQRARIEADVARDQLDNAQRLAADVARRLKAGDLARADQVQADGAVAAAESAQAQAQAAVTTALLQLRAITGLAPAVTGFSIEVEPGANAVPTDAHALLLELKDQAELAESAAALASAQSRANPELMLSASRERGALGEAYGQAITLGVRLPFGGGPRHDTRVASARADAAQARAQLALEHERLVAESDAGRARAEAARAQLAAAERRARLAAESRGFFDKSFRLGETDLPTRLRIEAEAAEAERQAARAQVELAAAISAWRQALGLLPQ
jgi:cobalt-zinc-cadmium efflux system outer membrane protein